jgi:phosphatidylserine decarboxylase
MKGPIHKEGFKIAGAFFIFIISLGVILFLFTSLLLSLSILTIALAIQVFLLRFFRNPERKLIFAEGNIYSPADGKVVVVEKTFEKEFLNREVIQVSIFMSVWNVHINWFPVSGAIKKYVYHPGKYLVARHPKSSAENERNSCLIETRNDQVILVRQIAGYVARRIISYATEGRKVNAGDELGFIRFGSRVDLFLPADTEIKVSPGARVKGKTDVIGVLKN